MTDVVQRTANHGLDQFIPVRKSDILSALVEEGARKSDEERKKFRRLCDMLAAIYHYEYFQTLERLRSDYYYFGPDVAPHAALDRASRDRYYDDLVQSLEQVLKEANFTELPHAEIGDAHGAVSGTGSRSRRHSTTFATCACGGAAGTPSHARPPIGSACAGAQSRPKSSVTSSSWWR
jgi:hypothetical protein